MNSRPEKSIQVNTPADQESFRQELEALYRSYTLSLPVKLDGIRDIAGLLPGEHDTGAVLRELVAAVHKVAGSAGTYGCPDVSSAARDCEILINGWLDAGTDPATRERTELEKALDRLAQAVDHAVASAD
ncbi:MAG: Hpt domain-containing protein [Thiohalobacterales bacterium]|nr:Hpt domain-containing protein [Thiohalobacterales bacterium]